MSGLSPETRALLDLGRGADEPSSDDLARVDRALAAKLGIGALTGVTGVAGAALSGRAAARVSGLLGASKTMSIAVSIAAGGAISTGAVLATTAVERPTQHQVHTTTVAAPPPRRFVSPPEQEQREPEVLAPSGLSFGQQSSPHREAYTPPGPNLSLSAYRVAPPPITEPALVSRAVRAAADPRRVSQLPIRNAPSPLPTSTALTVDSNISGELTLLRAAQHALHSGRSAEALTILDQHAARFPTGTLSEEREASRILVLCRLNRVAEARRAAQQFSLDHPASPFLHRVGDACGGGAGQAP